VNRHTPRSVILSALLLAACGGGDASPNATPTPDSGSNTNSGQDAGATSDAGASDSGQATDAGAGADATTDAAPPEEDAAPTARALGAGPCDTAWLAAAQPQPLPVTADLGGFSVQVRSDGRVDVTHARSGDRSLFASPRSGPVFAASRTDLHVEENQGSFFVDENVVETCSEPVYRDAFVDASGVVLQGSFADEACAGVTFEWQLCELAEGQLGLGLTTDDPTLDLLDLRVQSRLEEKIFGMGEQFPHDELDLKGRAIPVLSQEGGVGRGHQPISGAVNAVSSGSAGSEDSTYYAAPHYLTSDLRSLFLEQTDYAVFDFTNFDTTRVRLFAPAMTARVLQGESPLELVERFTAWAGRMPAPPDWVAEGASVALAGDLDASAAVIDDLLAADAAISAVWNQTWSGTANTFIGEQVLWNWIQNPERHPTWDTFVADMDARGVKTLCYINPMLRDLPEESKDLRRNLYREGVDNGYFVTKEDGSVYELEVTAFTVGLLDLTNPAAVTWYKDVIKDEMLTRAGCSGWMADFAEALPFEAVLHDGTSAATYHNQYPVDWIRLNREAVEEAGALGDVFVFNRSGAATSPRWAMMLWQGDQLTTWDKYDGLVSALHGLINGGLSGIALNHSDVGGYTSLSRYGLGYSREAEQLARWAEMSAFTAAMRTHQGNQPDANAQIYTDAEATNRFARMTRLFRALGFYRKQLYAEASDKGWPVVRHMLLHYPDDARAWRTDDQFLFGSEVLVAPIKNKCFNPLGCDYDKDVYLPAGEWIHFWTGQTYGDPNAGVEVTVQAPIGQPAAFYKKGSPIAAQLEANLVAEGLK
jgi:alpha-glucosidase